MGRFFIAFLKNLSAVLFQALKFTPVLSGVYIYAILMENCEMDR